MTEKSARTYALLIAPLLALAAFAGVLSGPARAQAADAGTPPNILFIILDDVGRDQLRSFNPLAVHPPRTPNIDAIAAAGLKFTNVSAMPECSPSRATVFTGRYPFRTGVNAALLSEDLAGAQLSPYEMTTPKVLKTAGYVSALFGKYHLGGPDNNPARYRTPSQAGWDYYDGNLQGGPPFIDKTLGGQLPDTSTRYSCGFPLGEKKGGCWFAGTRTGSKIRFDDNAGAGYSGKQCVEKGGIPALDGNGDFTRTCNAADGCKTPDFSGYNGYYAWNQTINDGNGLHRGTVRQYMTTYQTNSAIDWIKKQSQGGRSKRPWMATVSYDAIHTPYQPPPDQLSPPGTTWPTPGSEENCTDTVDLEVLTNLMTGAMDQEIGRLLVSTGLAQVDSAGHLLYSPQASNTMIVIMGDNGTYFSSVNYPYNPARAKGTPYETGVAAPLIVAGPQVIAPGRAVHAMVNSVDMFQLFGEMAGVDVRAVVPRAHVLDSLPLRPYLSDPAQMPLRQINYAELGDGLKPSTVQLYPCVLPVGSSSVCTDILFTSASLCQAELGTWYGPPDDSTVPQYTTCCEVRENVDPALKIVATKAQAIRNDRYKLVRQVRAACDTEYPDELYDLSPRPDDPANPLGIDNAENDLLKSLPPLTPEQATNYAALSIALARLTASEAVCPGDGNLDKKVDQKDRQGVHANNGLSSVFDFNADGITDAADLQIVEENFGRVCTP